MNALHIQEEIEPGKEGILVLVNQLEINRNEITNAWAHAIQDQMPDSIYGHYPIEKISRNNLIGLEYIRDLLLGIDAFSSEHAQGIPEHLLAFVQAGIPIQEVVEGTWLFEPTIEPILFRVFHDNLPFYNSAVVLLNGCAHRLVLDVVKYYAAEMNKQLQKEHQQTLLMLEMSRQAGSTLELANIIQQASHRMAAATGAEHCVIYLVEEDGVRCSLGATTDNLPSSLAEYLQRVSHRSFLFSSVPFFQQMVEQQNLVNLYGDKADQCAALITGKQWGIQAMMIIPVTLKSKLLAVVVVFTFEKDHIITERQSEIASGLASVIAPAIENARLYQEVERMAVLEERARLAQEIHDDLAQMICAMQFRICLANDQLTDGKITQAQSLVEDVQKMLNEANLGLHESIFNLRAVSNIDKGFLATLDEYLAAYRRNYNLDIQLIADKDATASLSGIRCVHTIRIIQEALSNAHRHGQASQVRVIIQRDNKGLCVQVEDNGIGFDMTQIEGSDQQHYGLSIMRERAEKISGNLRVQTEPGAGTRIVLNLPEPGQIK
ncbi:MAG: GAF domain-containing sensor histidine kinase [Chloroflexi bacterium]|nr:GAF domain-containing sensor histidine kinase [Chloroflexota bacterium]